MKTFPQFPGFPIFSNSLLESQSFDIEDSDDVLDLVKQLINGQHPGLLTTVDERGYPRSRWMATLALDEFPIFYTLTAPDSHKVQEINRYRGVGWTFFNQDLSLVLKMVGTACVRNDPATLKRAWKQVRDFSHAYFLTESREKAGFVAIETSIEHVLCTSAKNSLAFEINTEVLAHHHHG